MKFGISELSGKRGLLGINLACASSVLILSIYRLPWISYDKKRLGKLNVKEELSSLTRHDNDKLNWKHARVKWGT